MREILMMETIIGNVPILIYESPDYGGTYCANILGEEELSVSTSNKYETINCLKMIFELNLDTWLKKELNLIGNISMNE